MDIKCDFIFNGYALEISDDIRKNFLSIDGTDYYLYYIDPNIKSNKGGNSFVYKLFQAQTFDEVAEPDKVIKISKIKEVYSNNRTVEKKKNKRFRQEIEALYNCKKNAVENIIEISEDGNLICKSCKGGDYDISFPFYTMEFAECDLKRFFDEESENYDESSRVELCLQIAQGIKDLSDMGYYHRDIKPDNIFMINGTWKVGDLGLIEMRNKPSLDNKGELIGPRGWLSPEAMNKYLSERVKGKNFDCNIDHQSDLFQLAKIFWYIVQGNAPIGCIKKSDFLLNNSALYLLIREMLNHSKRLRPASVDVVINKLYGIVNEYYK